MELLNTLYNLMSLVFVLGTMASMGLSLTIAQITGPLRNARFVIMALLANFLVPPILAFLLIQVFALGKPVEEVVIDEAAPGSDESVDIRYWRDETGTDWPVAWRLELDDEVLLVEAVVDDRLAAVEHVYFEPGGHDRLVRLDGEDLREFVAANYVVAILAFALTYVVVVALSVPGGALLTITGGFLFGWLAGRGKRGAYVTGMVFYGLDGLIFLAASICSSMVETKRISAGVPTLGMRMVSSLSPACSTTSTISR